MMPQIHKNENLYNELIQKVSNIHNVDYSLIKAIIARESAFNPKAYKYEPHRNDASYGLMQILYQTAKNLGFKGKPEDLYEPYTNLYYSTLFLKHLIYRHKNLPDAIASYNMGYPRPASKTTEIIKKIYGEPKPDWIYANQPYVDYILAYYCFYKAIELKLFDIAWEIKTLILQKKYKEVWEKYQHITKPKTNFLPIIILFTLILLNKNLRRRYEKN